MQTSPDHIVEAESAIRDAAAARRAWKDADARYGDAHYLTIASRKRYMLLSRTALVLASEAAEIEGAAA